MMTPHFSDDLKKLVDACHDFPSAWDGRKCILEMREGGGRWRDMEWIGWYFEFLCKKRFEGILTMPSEKCGRCRFDGFGSVNWDFKAKAIKSDDHRAILNDKHSMDLSVATHGEHGLILGLFDVEYNDESRSFQKWHTELKGGKSAYELAREQRTAVSRYRKTNAVLSEILFLRLDADALALLDLHKQGRNSNGKPRPVKYMVNLEKMQPLIVAKIDFTSPRAR